MIYIFVNYQKTIVGFCVFVECYTRVLLIVFLYIQLKLF